MFPARGRSDERPGELNVAVRETDIFPLLHLDASRRTRHGTFAPPRERGDRTGSVALKLDS
jgi:hypothetical protein